MGEWKEQDVPLELVRGDGTQGRARLDDARARQIGDALKAGQVMPRADLFFDGKWYWIGDGHHRDRGARLAGRKKLRARWKKGDKRDALVHNIKTNAEHADKPLYWSDTDKRHAVELCVADPELVATLSNRQIAELCAASEALVRKIKSEQVETAHNAQPTEREEVQLLTLAELKQLPPEEQRRHIAAYRKIVAEAEDKPEEKPETEPCPHCGGTGRVAAGAAG